MTFLTLTLAALTLAASPDCSPVKRPLSGKVFTNADLDRLAACRPRTETRAETPPSPEPVAPTPGRRGARVDP